MVFFFSASCSSKKVDKTPILARVGNKKLRLSDINKDDSFSTPESVERWIDNTILYEEAIKKGFQQDSFIIKSVDNFYKDLVISSFVETFSNSKIKIDKDSIRSFYEKNRAGFIRLEDEVYVNHYLTENVETANRLLQKLNSKTGGGKINPSLYLSSSKYLKKSSVSHPFNKIFDSKNPIIGPIKKEGLYHLFDILNRFKKGSLIGLDLSQHEIYQRLYKKEEIRARLFLLDSLKKKTTIYINPGFK